MTDQGPGKDLFVNDRYPTKFVGYRADIRNNTFNVN